MKGRIYNLLILLLLSNSVLLFAQKKTLYQISGVVRDAQTSELLSFATIQVRSVHHDGFYSGITDLSGRYQIKGVPAGEYVATVSFLGYDQMERRFGISESLSLSFYLTTSVQALDEVVVTASESKGLTSASKIDRKAMEHLQPTSFTDLLELLPGGRSADPFMGAANLIRLREASSTSEIIASLGVQFLVDGMVMNTDANLQTMPTYSQGDSRESVGLGVDMRTLSTDNIESVEIIRGIPSVKYGNLTGGLVDIKRKQQATPFTARFKADQTGKLFSVGKGVNLLGNSVLNLDLSYLDSKVDPRRSHENYQRITASARWNSNKRLDNGQLRWSANADYTGSFDQIKRDKDVTMKEDRYRSDYDKLSLGTTWRWMFNTDSPWRRFQAKASLSHEWSRITERKSVSIDRPTGLPNNLNQGVADGIYLPYNYVADMVIDGKPLYTHAAVESDWGWNWGSTSHTLKAGADWRASKNYGNGQVYDTTRPMSSALSLRPRRYKEIPGMNELAWYVEEQMVLSAASHKLTFSAGVRGTSLLGLQTDFSMSGKLFLDPRFNVQWQLPAFGAKKDWTVVLNAGIGWLSRLPTLSQLYPNLRYVDIAQLNYYHVNPDYRKLNYQTYRWDNTNYALEPARNRKWEVRMGLSHRGHDLSATYFQEFMNNAFQTLTYYRLMPYRKYHEASVDPASLTAAPSLADFTSTPDTLINVYGMEGNATRVRKQGVELQYTSPRLSGLHTKLTLTGAWYRTTYSKRMPRYEEASVLINNQQIQYIGLYDWEEGSVNDRLSTNLTADTYLKRIGMTFSLSAQCTWFTARKQLWNEGVPVSYIDKSGTVRPYTEADKNHKQLKFLMKTYSDDYFERRSVPLAMDLNLKATKDVTESIHLSLFVNRLWHYYPKYKNGNVWIYRTTSPYFGMEANLTF